MASANLTKAFQSLKTTILTLDPTGGLLATANGVFVSIKALVVARKAKNAKQKSTEGFFKTNVSSFTKSVTQSSQVDTREQIASVFNLKLGNQFSEIKNMLSGLLAITGAGDSTARRSQADEDKQERLTEERETEEKDLDVADSVADAGISELT